MFRKALLILFFLLIPWILAAEENRIPIKVACVGDSITLGFGIKESENSYPSQLQLLLGKNYWVKNYGVSGATLLKNGNLPYWVQPDFLNSHLFKPQIVVIKLGTNDSKPVNWINKDRFLNDYLDLIQSYQKLESKPTVFICLPVPVIGDGNWGITDKTVKNEVIPLIHTVVEKAHVPMIDLYSIFSGKPALIPDRVHPNAEGAKLIAEAVFSAIRTKH